ncbi:hypothetical protein MtrunA17_Chr1g0179031 [Medicago truncatula]|uniref:Transmembrane protein n=1 Tax=Medicago truncatula TaxID=3880 RepID=A0A396JQ61_MEDTR|nr:hypothetical protein MtrunA17_Chr1g0179031 [Medicago truncatula]
MLMNMIVMPCAACALSVFIVSVVTAVIVFIIWIIVYMFAGSTMTTQPELTTSDRTSFKYITDMIFKLFYVLIVFVVVEITGFGDNIRGETSLSYENFVTSCSFHFSVRYNSRHIRKPTCSSTAKYGFDGHGMCRVCVLLVLLISTTAVVIVFIFWSVGILTVVVQRWTHIVQEMKAIRNVVENSKLTSFSQSIFKILWIDITQVSL